MISLLLLTLVPRPEDNVAFAMSVGGLGIALGLITAWLLGRLVTEPVDELRRATQAVAAGDLGVTIADRRADEFGQLIDGFNTMVAELRAKRRLEEDFGRHVGERIARQILERERRPRRGGGGADRRVRGHAGLHRPLHGGPTGTGGRGPERLSRPRWWR